MKRINVTKTYLPPLDEYIKHLKGIWKRGIVANYGPLALDLEKKLEKYLGVKHLLFVTNGTLALQVAIKALDLKNEVITTPFSYIATSSSLVWENCQPIFADIDPCTLTIDPKEIEKKITKKTTGIMATHVYGNPCNVERIQKIAKKHDLKVIYDGAHAFGVKYKKNSILNYGDISMLSFHATKIFHTIEGGAVITSDDRLAEKIFYLRNFGHVSAAQPEKIAQIGINAKSSEFQAAMGLCLLPKMKNIISARKEVSVAYDKYLNFDILKKPTLSGNTEYNYAYYPVLFPSEKILLRVQSALNSLSIFPRRYFYPSLNKVDYIQKMKKQIMPVADEISRKVLCLPLYLGLKGKDIKIISNIINSELV